MGRVLGKGGFSTVRSGVTRTVLPRREVALKILNKASLRDPVQARQVFHEIRVMQRVNAIPCPNLMRFLAAHEDVALTTGLPRFTIVTELYSGGELFDRIVSRGHYSERDAAELIAKLAAAFQALHSAGILHRDLKPENVLYASAAADAEPILADFGLARLRDAPDVHSGIVGTPAYVAPEIVTEKRYTEAGDAWALGVLAYILLCGYPTFYAERQEEMYRQIRAGVYEFHADTWSAISPAAKDLVARLLVVDDTRRLDMRGVLAHPWVASNTTTSHLPATLDNLRRFNARRKIKAAAAAVRLGSRISLNRELATVLSGHALSPEEVATLSSRFHTAAAGGSAVSLAQFKAIMEGSSLATLPLEHIFAVFDTDGSGDIEYKELLCGFAALRSDPEAATRLCFRIFDANGDGAISMHELVSLLQSTGVADEAWIASSPTAAATPTAAAGAAAAAAVDDSDAAAALSEESKLAALEALVERIDINKGGAGSVHV